MLPHQSFLLFMQGLRLNYHFFEFIRWVAIQTLKINQIICHKLPKDLQYLSFSEFRDETLKIFHDFSHSAVRIIRMKITWLLGTNGGGYFFDMRWLNFILAINLVFLVKARVVVLLSGCKAKRPATNLVNSGDQLLDQGILE